MILTKSNLIQSITGRIRHSSEKRSAGLSLRLNGSPAQIQLNDFSEPIVIPLAEFLQADFPTRIALVVARLQRRPSSLQLSSAWFSILDRAVELRLSRPEMHTLAEEAIALQPDSRFVDSLFEILLDERQERCSEATEPVLLIISCEKYLNKAVPLHQAIFKYHSRTFVVVGDPSAREAVVDGYKLIVPAGDAYEDLPKKVLESLVFARRKWKGSGVFKIDDDSEVIGPPNWEGISHMARAAQFAGYVMTRTEDRPMDRCWHIGKSRHRDMTPYRGRYRGSYAAGASYYLGPIAIDTLVKDYFKYRDEFNIELFEDKAIGSILFQNGIEPRAADVAGLLGLKIEEWVKGLR
jgi:hypothetical protein